MKIPPQPEKTEEQIEEERLWNGTNVSSISHTFENYKITEANKKSYEVMLSLSKGGKDTKFVLLYGVPGCGKTHLIEALLIAWAKQGIKCRYATMSQIMRQLKNAIRNGGYDELYKRFCEATILVIDDYGAGVQETAFEIADIEDIVNERYHRRYREDGKVTIMATNKDIKELPQRVVDRFADPEFGEIVLNEANSYRRRL